MEARFPAHVMRACDEPTCVHQATDLLALPGIIRGSLDVDAAFVDDGMRVAAVKAMVALAPGAPTRRRRSRRRSAPPLVPSLVDPRLVPAVASSVASAAVASGAGRSGDSSVWTTCAIGASVARQGCFHSCAAAAYGCKIEKRAKKVRTDGRSRSFWALAIVRNAASSRRKPADPVCGSEYMGSR